MIRTLIMTIIIEWVVMWLLTHSIDMCKYNLYCNLVTNPIMNLLLGCAMLACKRWFAMTETASYFIPLMILEPIVVFAEMQILKLITREASARCFKLSFITNAVSALIGVVWFFCLSYLKY